MGSPSAPIGAAPNAHIYCHFCASIQPLVIDEPQQGEDSRFDCATDLVCAACQFVVATAYTPRRGAPQGHAANRGGTQKFILHTA